MKKILIVLLCLSIVNVLIGCQNTTKDNETIPANTTPIVTDNNGEEAADYSWLKGNWKLKVSEDEELYRLSGMLEYLGSTGIQIKEVNENKVAGSIHSVQGPPSYRQAEVSFSGVIEDGVLRSTYEDTAWEYTGVMELSFEEEQIKAKFVRDETEMYPMWGIPEGEFVFARAINTEKVNLSSEKKDDLESFLRSTTKELLKPFAQGTLTEEAITSTDLSVQLLLQDRDNPGIYYAITDYAFSNPEGEEPLKCQYLIKLQMDGGYVLKGTTEIVYPIDFAMFNN